MAYTGNNSIPPRTGPVSSSSAGGVTPPENQSEEGSMVQPNVRPKMAGLQPDRAPKKSLRERMAATRESTVSTGGLGKKNSPEALLNQRHELLSEVRQLSTLHEELKIFNEALHALKTPDVAPDNLLIQVQIGDRMVAIVPPDLEALQGQDVKQLLKEVEDAIKSGYAKCTESVGPAPLQAQFQELQESYTKICTKLGNKHLTEQEMRDDWSSAFQELPESMPVDYSGGVVLIQRVAKQKEKPPESDQQPQPLQPE